MTGKPRRLAVVGKPGRPTGPPRVVEQQIPVTAIAHADGTVEVVDTDADPCFGCPCCAKWARSLEQLRAGIAAHDELGHAGGAPDLECMVCVTASGLLDR